jgi:uncharacterized protein YyaL (SSP411 family)
MTDERGGFYSAEDADSEGIEGKFYLWSVAQLRDVLGDRDAELVVDMFGAEDAGNFAEEVAAANILYMRREIKHVAPDHDMSEEELTAKWNEIRPVLFEARKKRIPPYKDDKVMTDWNGLMIAALAKAGRAFNEPEYTARARRAADFVLTELRKDDGRLLHRYRHGKSGIDATIDDYAFLTWGLTELYENTFDVSYLKTALDLTQILIDEFWDEDRGGFFMTADDAETLIVRMKEIFDGAIPSGNSVAMYNLIRLGRITADKDMEATAQRIGGAFFEEINRAPSSVALLMLALDFGVGPSYEVVLVGDPDGRDTRDLSRALNQKFVPNKVVLFKPTGKAGEEVSELAEYTRAHSALDGKATAYVCRNYACELPTTEAERMLELQVFFLILI